MHEHPTSPPRPGSCFPVHLRWLVPVLGSLLVLGSLVAAGHTPDAEARLSAEGILFRSGDVLFLRGNGLLTQAVLAVDDASAYSHVGLVHQVGSTSLLVHASPGDSLAETTRIRVEPIERVFAESRAAVLYRPRPPFREIGARAAAIAHRYVDEGRTFDAGFCLDTERELYCTELVWRAYREAGLDLAGGRFDDLSLPLFHEPCILPSRLQRSPYLRRIGQLELKGRLP